MGYTTSGDPMVCQSDMLLSFLINSLWVIDRLALYMTLRTQRLWMDNISLPDIAVMACLEPSDGTFLICSLFHPSRLMCSVDSAEALVQLIISDIKNETWKIPNWLPHHFITTSGLDLHPSTVAV
jgi:hypothetical protein